MNNEKELRSLQGELDHSHDYADVSVYPDLDVLMESGHYWALQLDSEERSPRAKIEINRVLARIIFEVLQREKEQQN